MNHKKPTTILITGAAKRIGAALAEHFAARGHDLVLHYYRSAKEAKALAARLQKTHGVRVTLHAADLRDSAKLGNFFKGLPPCGAVIHNAALFERDRLETMHSDALSVHLATNFVAPLILTQGFMKQLPKNQTGAVLVLGDGVDGWSISPEFFSYAISKQAWKGALDLLASACAPRARVNLLALAPTLRAAQESAAMYARLAARAPLKRTGTVAEVCATAEYLLNAPGVTGQIISLANGSGLMSYHPDA
jgi:NAD(P)-dependent dehydrogenase (short-subunit alcohol dehydrogenase family)